MHNFSQLVCCTECGQELNEVTDNVVWLRSDKPYCEYCAEEIQTQDAKDSARFGVGA
jgi:hypothetical protein